MNLNICSDLGVLCCPVISLPVIQCVGPVAELLDCIHLSSVSAFSQSRSYLMPWLQSVLTHNLQTMNLQLQIPKLHAHRILRRIVCRLKFDQQENWTVKIGPCDYVYADSESDMEAVEL